MSIANNGRGSNKENIEKLKQKLRKCQQEESIPALARDPDLIKTIRNDLKKVGLVGEEDNGLLVYLAYSSRKLNKPLSIIVKGPSGSGKDQVQRRPADLMPPEAIVDGMSITPQALYYNDSGWLINKVILGGERAHQEDDAQRDRTVAIRQMLSHGYITKQTVLQGQTVSIRQDGPVSYSETTTKDSVFEEDANRCFQISTNVSSKQTQRILNACAEQYLSTEDSLVEKVKEVKLRHHEFQKWLNPLKVSIPFAKVLAQHIPTGRVEVRRVFGHVLTLIEVIAYLHQGQRRMPKDRPIEATLEDYHLARQLVLGPLHVAIGLGTEHDQIAPLLAKLPEGIFTSQQAADALQANSRKVNLAWLNKLAGLHLIRCVEKAIGNQPAKWIRTNKRLDESLLPTVERLRSVCG